MKKNKKMISLLLVLIFTFSISFPSAIAAKPKDSIAPFSDYVLFDDVNLANGESYIWKGSNAAGYYLIGGNTYQFSAACIDTDGYILNQPFQVELKGTWANGNSGGLTRVWRSKKNVNGYIYGVEETFTVPIDGYFTFTVTNLGLSEKTFIGQLVTDSY